LRKIAIVGAHSRTKRQAPFASQEWAIWSLSLRNERELPRHDVWFELHAPSEWTLGSPSYPEWLQTLPCVMMRPDFSHLLPGGVPYPVERIVQRFGRYFFNSTLSWMAAKAIDEQPATIGFWGVASGATEYAAQVPMLRHFAQVARDAGIEVIAPNCTLLDPEPLYGFDYP
jgi:hypothetical protein